MAKEIGSWGSAKSPERVELAAKRLLDSRLAADEKLIWAACGSGLSIGWHLPLTALRAAVLCAFVTALTVGAFPTTLSFAPIFALLFFILLAHSICLPMLQAYGLTASRVMIVSRLFPPLSRSLAQADITALRVRGTKGRGSISLNSSFETLVSFSRGIFHTHGVLGGVSNPLDAARLIQSVLASSTPVDDLTK